METTRSLCRPRIILSWPYRSLLAAALAVVASACTDEVPTDDLADARRVDDDRPDAALSLAPDAAAVTQAPDAASPTIILGAGSYAVEWVPTYSGCGAPLTALPNLLQLPGTDAEEVEFSSTRCASAPVLADVVAVGDELTVGNALLPDCSGAAEELQLMTLQMGDGIFSGTAITHRLHTGPNCSTGWELQGKHR